MTERKNGRERRRWPRAPLRGRVVGQIYTEHAAPILDLSEGGALLEVPCALRPGSAYSVRFVMAGGAVMTVKAKVVRSYVHRVESAGAGETQIRYQAALQFIDCPPRDQDRLRQWIASESAGGMAGLAETPAADQAAPADRRDSVRVDLGRALKGEVALHLESRVLMLSPGGMTVRMPFRPEIGSTVSCTLDLDGAATPLRGLVRDTYADAGEENGAEFRVGVEFVDLTDSARASIDALLKKVEPA